MKSRSIKGEYGIDYAIGTSGVRNFQELLDRRNQQLAAQMADTTPEHRMEFVKSFRGVDFINDAASENANGIYMALSDRTKPTTWITSFTDWNSIGVDLLQLIIQKVNAIVFYGEEDDQTRSFIEALNIHHEQSEDLETAVRIAFYSSRQGDEVLFCHGTPATNCAERGSEFKSSVAQL